MMIHSPLEQFQVNSIIGFNLGWFDISITNSSIAMFLAIGIFLFITNFSIANLAIIPGRWQSVLELTYEFIHTMVQEVIGHKGYKFFPFVFTLFIFIASSNLLGMIPYNFTATSQAVVTFGLSFSIFLGVTFLGFAQHGLHFFSLLVPSGIPLALAPMIVAIEFISYLTRAISLGIRLFANMFAGHTLLKIIATFTWQMLMAGGVLAVAGIAPMALLFALTGLELVIAVLQAYVFTILTCSYLNDSINLH